MRARLSPPRPPPQPQHCCMWGHHPAQGVPGSAPPRDTFSLKGTNLSFSLAFLLTPRPQFQSPSRTALQTPSLHGMGGGETPPQQLSSPLPLFPSPIPFPKHPSGSMLVLRKILARIPRRAPGAAGPSAGLGCGHGCCNVEGEKELMGRRQHRGDGSAPKGAGEGQEGACAGLWSSRVLQQQAGTWYHHEATKNGEKNHNETNIAFIINNFLFLQVLRGQHCCLGLVSSPVQASAAHRCLKTRLWVSADLSGLVPVSCPASGWWFRPGGARSPSMGPCSPSASLISAPSRFWGELAPAWVSPSPQLPVPQQPPQPLPRSPQTRDGAVGLITLCMFICVIWRVRASSSHLPLPSAPHGIAEQSRALQMDGAGAGIQENLPGKAPPYSEHLSLLEPFPSARKAALLRPLE